jgi:glycosyltransferase involved in cell wall biosynthesis
LVVASWLTNDVMTTEIVSRPQPKAATTEPPLVAVVTPVYNGAHYLRELMESVQAQTYPNLVHAVLDNCSDDATADIIAAFANARVPVITLRNDAVLPLSANWNAALQLVPADAKYVRVISHDDLLPPHAIERLVAVGERHPEVGVIISDVSKFEDNGAASITTTKWPADVERVDGREAIKAYFRNERVIVPNQVMFRKSVMDARGPNLYPEDILGSDPDAVLSILKESDLGVAHEPLAHERLHGQSQSASVQARWKYAQAEWLMTMRRYGPAVYSESEWRDVYGRYKRRYLRRMFKWRFSAHGRRVVARHMAMLRGRGVRITFWDYLVALADGIPVKLGLKPGWASYPW